MKQSSIIIWLLSFVKPLRGKMALAITLGIISNLAVVAIPVIGAKELWLLFSGAEGNPLTALFVMVGCGILRGIARYSEQYLNHDIAFRLLAHIREEIFSVLRKLGPAKLTGKQSGELITAITSDVEALEVFFAHTISPTFIAIGTTLFTVGFLWYYDVGMALILLAGQLLVGGVIPIVGYQRNKAIGDDYQSALSALNQQVMENVESLQDITQYDLSEQRLEQLEKTGKALNSQYQGRLKQSSILQILSEIVLLGTAVCLLIYGGAMEFSGELVMLGTILSLSSFGSVLALSGLGNALLTTLASGRRLRALVQEEPTTSFRQSNQEITDFSGISLDKVSFAYDHEQQLLDNLSLEIPQGSIVGIGGESGSGKSTLLKLLMRYWDPQSGTIQLNDVNLKTITEYSIHQLEGVMEQATFIFEDTIASNISLRKSGVSIEEIEEAAKQAALHEWVCSLPEGYDTIIGGQARAVSDGERQRFGLARLFLHDAPLLLLDEPTSNLDYLNEQEILNALSEASANKTIFLISHRATTLAFADQQLFLAQGKLHLN
ncbi:amino acid ABC transporter ATP-binding/permease protein [Enterococcus sp. BWR-S5]|uniref:amino acid ABC transporter ATP-binding/permease protein n=1 Tax=Enterococcus sp. BWR-S5 TaxID=2787714 RepID=UPI001924FA47|nr:ABC transporter ATP-binding protein [Enterococcus sp. BWR-S5]MBL1225065.1 ABC transporter ATP-binding protein [Enterococcus sp. BWR-S5]